MKNNLRDLRKARGLTLKQVADGIGTSNQQISGLEMGTRRLNEDWIIKLCNFYKVGISQLLGDQDEIESSKHSENQNETIKSIILGASLRGKSPAQAVEEECVRLEKALNKYSSLVGAFDNKRGSKT